MRFVQFPISISARKEQQCEPGESINTETPHTLVTSLNGVAYCQFHSLGGLRPRDLAAGCVVRNPRGILSFFPSQTRIMFQNVCRLGIVTTNERFRLKINHENFPLVDFYMPVVS